MATAKTLSAQLGQCGWTLTRTPVNKDSGWHRWCVRLDGTPDVFRFYRLDEVEDFWRSSYLAHLALKARATVLAGWCEDDASPLQGTVAAWLAGSANRLPTDLREQVRGVVVPPLPMRWRDAALRAGDLLPPGRTDLRVHVRQALAALTKSRLESLAGALGTSSRHRL